MNVTLIGMGSGQPGEPDPSGPGRTAAGRPHPGRTASAGSSACRLHREPRRRLPPRRGGRATADFRRGERRAGLQRRHLVLLGASSMMEKLEALGVRARVLPGLSSIQLLAAALGRPWQGWNLVSAHGRTCDPVAECMQGRPTFFLTGGSEDPATLCAQLAAEGFGDVQGVVGQCLGTPEEKLFRGSVKELAAGRFNSLSVLLVEAAEVLPRRDPGPAGRSLRAGRRSHDQAGSPGRCAGEAGRPPGRHPVGRGGRDGQRQRGAGIGRAPGPGVRSGVQAGGMCAHQSQPRKIQDPEPRPRGRACPRRAFGSARAGRCLYRRQQGQPCRHRGRRAG